MEFLHCNIELNSNTKKAEDYYVNDMDYKEIMEDIIKPYINNEEFIFDGYRINPKNIKRIRIVKTPFNAQHYKDLYRARMNNSGIVAIGVNQSALVFKEGLDITRDLIKKLNQEILKVKDGSKNKEEVKHKNKIPKVFLVHGQDHGTLRRVKEFIKEDIGMEPIVLMDEANNGKTIPEKFEEYANECDYAIILMTPDDKLKYEGIEETIYRARQNVILELGYFWHKFNRKNFCVLKKGNIESPSDIQGIVYLEFKNEVEEVFYRLTKEIKASLSN